ncbi:MAG: hypothetical protein ACTSXZ_10005 [Alphaproteobacteria bacterium]
MGWRNSPRRGGARRRTGGFLAVLLLGAGLAACAPVKLAGDYDPAIDRGLTAYQEATLTFLARMAAATGAAASYESNKEFYFATGAKLDGLITRARVTEDTDRCLPADYAGRGIAALVGKINDLLPLTQEMPEAGRIFANLRARGSGSCTVVVLRAVRANHDILQIIHRHNDKLAAVVVDIVTPTIEQGVRIALKNELAKRRGGE